MFNTAPSLKLFNKKSLGIGKQAEHPNVENSPLQMNVDYSP